MYFLQIIWDPATEGIALFGDFKIHYYSLMWMAAFVSGWFLMKKIYKNEGQSEDKLDSLFMYSVLGIMIGARLGHVIFYQSELFREDFFSVFLPFSFSGGFEFTGFRGLASHGAAVGMIISMWLYNKKVLKKSVLWILDRVVIACALGAVFIRVGNFFNSEIVGNYTGNNFGVIFSNRGEIYPRHPAQLYESFGYIILFIILYKLYQTSIREKEGTLFGYFLIGLFSIRFVVEFMKESQGGIETFLPGLSTGQWLSIPFIIIGIIFLFIKKKKTLV